MSRHKKHQNATLLPPMPTQLYRDVTVLIEEANHYIHGEGRLAMRRLPPDAARFYAHQAMQLSTRLMQTAGLLLLVRAVTEGDMSVADMERERAKITFDDGTPEAQNPLWVQLPESFCAMYRKSLFLAWRASHLDREGGEVCFSQGENAVEGQMNRIKNAFAHNVG